MKAAWVFAVVLAVGAAVAVPSRAAEPQITIVAAENFYGDIAR